MVEPMVKTPGGKRCIGKVGIETRNTSQIRRGGRGGGGNSLTLSMSESAEKGRRLSSSISMIDTESARRQVTFFRERRRNGKV